jgi:hypothetical protein
MPSRFCPPTFALSFQALSPSIFFFFQTKEENKNTENKNHRKEKKMQIREEAYFQGLPLPSHFWLPLLPSSFCHFVSSAFSWHLFLLKQKNTKKNKKEKKKP